MVFFKNQGTNLWYDWWKRYFARFIYILHVFSLYIYSSIIWKCPCISSENLTPEYHYICLWKSSVCSFELSLLAFVCLYKKIRSSDVKNSYRLWMSLPFSWTLSLFCPMYRQIWWFFTFWKVNLIPKVITPCHMGFIICPDLKLLSCFPGSVTWCA